MPPWLPDVARRWSLASCTASVLEWRSLGVKGNVSLPADRRPSPERERGIIPGPAWKLWALAAALAAACTRPPELTLEPAQVAALAAGEAHTYGIHLESQELLHVTAEQRGVDVELILSAPGGDEIIRMDTVAARWGYLGTETVLAVATTPGSHRLQVRALGDTTHGGLYRLKIVEHRHAGREDRVRVAALGHFARGENHRRGGAAQAAVTEYHQALTLWRETGGDPRWRARALFGLGQVHRRSEEWEPAARALEEAAALFAQFDNGGRWHQAHIHDLLLLVHQQLGDFEAARHHGETARQLWPPVKDRRAEAINLNNLGHLYRQLGHFELARDTYTEALERWETVIAGGHPDKARAHHNRGRAYLELGDWDNARDDLNAALDMWDSPADQAVGLNSLASLHRRQGDLDTARVLYHQSLDRRAPGSRGEAVTRASLGVLYEEADELDEAFEHQKRALSIFRRLKDGQEEATALHNLGLVLVRSGLLPDARRHFHDALALYRRELDLAGEAATLLELARLERLGGGLEDLLEAQRLVEMALESVELLRSRSAGLRLRSSYFATKQSYADFYVDLLMDMHALDPGAGYERLALSASERSRARSLLDLIEESGLDPTLGLDPALKARRESLQVAIRDNDLLRRSLAEAEAPPERIAQLRGRGRDLLRRLDRLQTEIRRNRPGSTSLGPTAPLSAEEIQSQVLDDETLLLEYKLGEERSFLWAVTRDSLASFELPARERLEEGARQVRELLQDRNLRVSRVETHPAILALSRTLLSPVAPLLPGRRLLIVAEGALQHVPFAVLTPPRAQGPEPGHRHPLPLVAGHEIVTLPSASTVATLRRREPAVRWRAGSLVVVADPVYCAGDPRLGGSGDYDPDCEYSRLKHSGEEARAILDLAPGAALGVTGFDANLDAVRSGRLRGHEVVHFATHVAIDHQDPRLSRLVLSRFDADGTPRDGMLYEHAIHTLTLPADLVVLSGCETALGQEVRGEGVGALAQGFLNAGARRVVVSLWRVNDRAAAELMARFYRKLLHEGHSAATALALAQDSMRREEAWSAPYYWAGFTLLGDWRDPE